MRAFFAVKVSEVPRRGAELVFHVKQDKWGLSTYTSVYSWSNCLRYPFKRSSRSLCRL